MFERRLNYNETKELINKKILNKNDTHIIIDKYSKNNLDEWLINDIKINEDKKEILFDVINCKTAITNNREPIWIPYFCIKEISNMPIECVLDAYEMDVKEIMIFLPTDIEKTVLNKKYANIEDYELQDGLKIILHNDKNEKYNNKTLTVKGVGDSIKLVASRGRPKKIRKIS